MYYFFPNFLKIWIKVRQKLLVIYKKYYGINKFIILALNIVSNHYYKEFELSKKLEQKLDGKLICFIYGLNSNRLIKAIINEYNQLELFIKKKFYIKISDILNSYAAEFYKIFIEL